LDDHFQDTLHILYMLPWVDETIIFIQAYFGGYVILGNPGI